MATNVSTIALTDGRIVLLSYGRPVAVRYPEAFGPAPHCAHSIKGWTTSNSRCQCDAHRHYAAGFVRAESRHYSRTTTRHINAFARQHGALIETVDEQTFNAAIAPLAR